jgi:murein DD-endopeptidase MepM/ murein hydrolase activator NlpD
MRSQLERTLFTFLVAVCALFGCAHNTAAPQKLTGLWHKVQSGDTAASVSNRYAADSEVLIELNDLPQSGSLAGRDEIFVSKEGGKPPGTGASPSAGQVLAVSAPKARCGVGGRPCLEWPVKGRVSSGFGARSNGKVLYSGDDIKGYGNLIIMRHDNSIITVYAHNEENLVKEGDTVKRGQSIAKVGDTGSANGVHLHFEVRVDEQPKDPLLYLPPE